MVRETDLQREIHRERLQGLFQEMDSAVWSKPGYPKDHRPDVDALLPGIQLGDSLSPYVHHPAMKVELLHEVEEQERQGQERFRANHPAWYAMRTRNMVFQEEALMLPDTRLKRLISHEAAHDIFGQPIVTPPDRYTHNEKAWVLVALSEGFLPPSRPPLEETNIVKEGFRKTIRIGEYALANYYSAEQNALAEDLDEIYPTAVEIITEQLMNRGGDVASLDQATRVHGLLQISPLEDHPSFASMLFQVMELIDWRDILTAYKTGDFQEVGKILGESPSRSHSYHTRRFRSNADISAGVMLELLDTMKRDEDRISRIKSSVMSLR